VLRGGGFGWPPRGACAGAKVAVSMIWTAVALTRSELSEVRAAPDPLEAVQALPPERWSGLDKAWDAAHWLITGGKEPVAGTDGFITSGGQELEEVEAAHGPARYFEPKQTSAIRDLLGALTRERLASRWDADAIREDEVYPFAHAGVREGDRDFVLGHLDDFRTFLAGLDVRTFGLLVFLE
jgi:hypothetical protein